MSAFVVSPNFAKFLPELKIACQQLKLTLSDNQQNQLLYYLQQLLFWNKAYNLTAIKDERQALIKHIFDSLALVPFMQSQNFSNILDVGTGAGLPAVILAICCPDSQITALDSNSKKIRFIKQVTSEVGLKNVMPLSCRIEDYHERYAAITSRAFASLVDFVTLSQDKLVEDGQIVAMKGILPLEEIAILQPDWQIQSLPLTVPQLDEQRHLILLKK